MSKSLNFLKSSITKFSTKITNHRLPTCPNMSKKALVFLAEGTEEMEAVIAIDVLRRGGVEVTVAGIPNSDQITCSRGVKILPDIPIAEANCKGPFDAIVLPGGLGGAKALANSKEVGKLVKEQEANGRITAAICAAPTALKAHGVYIGKKLTSYPAMEKELIEGAQYTYKNDPVVVDGTLITSRGPGTAFQFALTILDKLNGRDKACEVSKGMLVTYS